MKKNELYVNPQCPVPILQSQYEFTKMLEIYKKLSPRKILEIGSYFGGSLWHWMTYTHPGAHFTVVDKYLDPDSWHPNTREQAYQALDGQHQCHEWLWKQWANVSGSTIEIYEDSASDEVYTQVQKSAPFDFAFIDGDHSYNGVKNDYIRYKGLVRPGGIIAFHDILVHTEDQTCQVNRLWDEIRADGNIIQELYTSVDQGGMGIGLIYV